MSTDIDEMLIELCEAQGAELKRLAERLRLAEAVVEAARHECQCQDAKNRKKGLPVECMHDNLHRKVTAYDAAKDRQPERVGGAIARPSGPEAVATPADPEPPVVTGFARQYTAICRHALWLTGSCPECHTEEA